MRTLISLLALTSVTVLSLSVILPVHAGAYAPQGDAAEMEDEYGDDAAYEEELAAPNHKPSHAAANQKSGVTATNYKFLDFRLYNLQATSSTSYVNQMNAWDITTNASPNTSSETVGGTFYAWLPNTAPAFKTFKLSKPVASTSTPTGSCTTWLFEFATIGTTAFSSCSLKVCLNGSSLEFTNCTTGYTAHGLIY